MQRRGAGSRLGAVLFTDIVSSTLLAAEIGNTRWAELVARHHRTIRRLLARFGGREEDTAGDGFFATFDRPADAIRCAAAAVDAVRELGVEIRAGIAFGELERVGDKAGGLVVNTAARVMAVAGPGEVLVPASVKDLVPGSGLAFGEHGVHRLKGLDGEFRLYRVVAVDGEVSAPPLDAEEAAERRREIFPTPGGRRSSLIIGIAAGLLALGVVAVVLVASREAPTIPPSAPGPLRDAAVQLDPSDGRVLSSVFLGGRTDLLAGLDFIDDPIAAGEGGVWVLRPPNLIHVDPLRSEVRGQIELGQGWANVETGFGAVWAQNGPRVYRVHPGTEERQFFLELPMTPSISNWFIAVGDAVWVGGSDGTLVRMDPGTGARDQVDIGGAIDGLAATREAVWLADVLAGAVIRIDADSMQSTGRPIRIRGTIDELVADDDSVWVLDKELGIVSRIDATTGSVIGTERVGDDPSDIDVGLGSVWVGDRAGSVFRIDRTTLEVTQLPPIGAEVVGVAVDERAETLWVYLGAATG